MTKPRARLSAIPVPDHPTFAGIEEAVVFELPMTARFRGITKRDGILLRGPAGWGEFAPFWNYDAQQSSPWLSSAIEAANAHPSIIRDCVRVNLTVPVVDAEGVLSRIEAQSGCATAKVKVADNGHLDKGDLQRVRQCADQLLRRHGSEARVRIDANAAWSVDEAREALLALDAAAEAVGGLEYAEQPCATVAELAALGRLISVPIAADESIRLSKDPLAVRRNRAADVAVLKFAPLGGARRALALQQALDLPAVVSSALDTSVGLASGVLLACALPKIDYACGLNTATLLAVDVFDDQIVADRTGTLFASDAERTLGSELTKHCDSVPRETVDAWVQRLGLVLTANAESCGD